MRPRHTYRHPRLSLRSSKVALGAGVLLLLPAALGAGAALSGALLPDPAAFVGAPNAGPHPGHWLGTDALGRDLLSRLASASARFALPGLLAVATALGLGGLLGVAGGLAGRLPGALASWVIQVLDSVPKLVLVLLVAAITGSQLPWIMATVGLTFAPQVAGAIRSSIDRLKATAFIEAERSLGVGMGRVVFVHILWGHARRLLLAQVTSLLAYAVLVESSLSYLGGELGVQEPAASWGNMLALARDGLFQGHFLPAFAPAALISCTLLGFSLLGQGLLEAWEERQ